MRRQHPTRLSDPYSQSHIRRRNSTSAFMTTTRLIKASLIQKNANQAAHLLTRRIHVIATNTTAVPGPFSTSTSTQGLRGFLHSGMQKVYQKATRRVRRTENADDRRGWPTRRARGRGRVVYVSVGDGCGSAYIELTGRRAEGANGMCGRKEQFILTLPGISAGEVVPRLSVSPAFSSSSCLITRKDMSSPWQ